MPMHVDSRIMITGASGMVGTALQKHLRQSGFHNLYPVTRKEADLADKSAVFELFEKLKPEHVFMIAARVGGIAANVADPVGFLVENLKMETNLFEACHHHRTKKNLFLGSSCIFPRNSKQPMTEEELLTGTLEPTNEGYALSKIVGIRMAQYYYKQYGMLTILPMPANIYGTNDHFDFDRSHVLSALVRRFVDARLNNQESVTLWGTGTALREFIHVVDVARALVFLMENYESPEIINLGTGIDISIQQLAEMIARYANFEGAILWDKSKPDGMPRKCLDLSKLNSIGFRAEVSLETGIRQTIKEYERIRKIS